MNDTTRKALEQSLEALQLCLTQLYHDGVMIEPCHPKRIAATAAENCAVKIADILGAANANPVSIPDLTPFITWLENGCDPKEAAKELRIYRNMAKSAANAAQDGEQEQRIAELESENAALSAQNVRFADDIVRLDAQLSTARAEGFDPSRLELHYMEGVENGGYYLATDVIRALQCPDRPAEAPNLIDFHNGDAAMWIEDGKVKAEWNQPANDLKRMQSALDGESIHMPPGLSLEERRQFIISHTDQPANAAEAKPESKGQTTRKAFICKSCEGVYADEPVTQCDCVPGEDEFIEGTISYPAALPAPVDAQPVERNSAGETPTEHAHRWATELAASMARKFYPKATRFEPLPDLLGVITQIDNMTTGLVRARPVAGALDERTEFEAWARPKWRHPEDFDPVIGAKGLYNNYELQAAWSAWQKRAALSGNQVDAQPTKTEPK